jgi:hypothetical protein
MICRCVKNEKKYFFGTLYIKQIEYNGFSKIYFSLENSYISDLALPYLTKALEW